MRLVRAVLLLLAVSSLPVPAQDSGGERPSSALMIVFDGSGSMWGRLDGSKAAKFEIATEALGKALPKVPPDMRSGLAGFGAGARSCSQAGVLAAPQKHEPDRLLAPLADWNPRGKGPLVAALQAAAAPFAAGREAVSLVLVYDGSDNCQQDACAASASLKKANPNLRIHLVGLGLREEDARATACVAASTGGGVFNAHEAGDVENAIEQAVTTASLQAAPRPVASAPAVEHNRVLDALGAPGIVATLALGKGGPATGVAVDWQIVAQEARGSDGGPGAVPILARQAAPLALPLPPGRYRVRAESGPFRVESEVDLGAGEKKHVALAVDAGVVDVSATIGGSLPLSDQAFVEIRRNGDPPGTAIQGLGSGDLAVLLAPGNYRIGVRDGLLTSQRAIEVRTGRKSSAEIDLAGGRLKISAKPGEGVSEADLGRLRVVLLEDDPGARTGRRELARTTARHGDWALPAGTYYLVTEAGYGESIERVTVTPGEVTSVNLTIGLRRVRLSATTPDGLAIADEDHNWRIVPIGGDHHSPALLRGRSVEIALGYGRYRVESSIGRQNAMLVRDLVVTASSAPDADFQHEVGAVGLRVSGGTGKLSYWDVMDKAGDRVWSGAAASPDLHLKAGSYEIVLWGNDRDSRRKISVRPGSRQTVNFDGE